MSLFPRLVTEEAGEHYGGRVRVLSPEVAHPNSRGGGHRAPCIGCKGADRERFGRRSHEDRGGDRGGRHLPDPGPRRRRGDVPGGRRARRRAARDEQEVSGSKFRVVALIAGKACK